MQPLRRLYSTLTLSLIHEEHPVVSLNQYNGERLTRCYYAVYCVERCPRLSAPLCRLQFSYCRTPISRECSRLCHQEPVSAMHFLKFTVQIYVKIVMSIEICKRIILHLRNCSAHFCIKIRLHFFFAFPYTFDYLFETSELLFSLVQSYLIGRIVLFRDIFILCITYSLLKLLYKYEFISYK